MSGTLLGLPGAMTELTSATDSRSRWRSLARSCWQQIPGTSWISVSPARTDLPKFQRSAPGLQATGLLTSICQLDRTLDDALPLSVLPFDLGASGQQRPPVPALSVRKLLGSLDGAVRSDAARSSAGPRPEVHPLPAHEGQSLVELRSSGLTASSAVPF